MEAETSGSLLDLLIVAVAFGFITMKVAGYRRAVGSATLWFIAGATFFILALPAAFLVKVDPKKLKRKKCPHCAQLVGKGARTCRFCNYCFTERARE